MTMYTKESLLTLLYKFKNYSPFWWTLIFSAIFVWFGLVFTDLYIQSDIVYMRPDGVIQHVAREPSIELFNYAFSIIFAFLIVVITWFQLLGLNKIGRSDLIIRIIDLYNSPTIIEAVRLIHHYSIEVENNRELISDKIKSLKKDPKKVDDFICLKAYLDFLESIAYLYNKKLISMTEVDDFLIHTLRTHYECFEGLIGEYQEINSDFYKELAMVYQSQKKRNNITDKKYTHVLDPEL